MRRPGLGSRGATFPPSWGFAALAVVLLLLSAGPFLPPSHRGGPPPGGPAGLSATWSAPPPHDAGPAPVSDPRMATHDPVADRPGGAVPTVEAVGPAAAITATLNVSSTAILAPADVTFIGTARSAASPGATNYHFYWLFGDASAGRSVDVTVPAGQRANSTVVHHYSGIGLFNVSMNVTDNFATDRAVVRTVQVTSKPPLVITANATPAVFTLGSTTRLHSIVSGGYPPYIYGWTNTPGGCVQNGTDDNCTPSFAGTYSPRATIVDAKANKASQTVTFVANPRLAPVTSLASTFRCNGTEALLFANFTANVTGGTVPYTTWWSLGDGSPNVTGVAAAHTYTNASNYTAVFTATDSGGGRSTRNVSISGSFPDCGTVTPPSFALPLIVVKALIVLVVILIAVLALLVWMGRRKPPRTLQPPDPAWRGNPPGKPTPPATRTP